MQKPSVKIKLDKALCLLQKGEIKHAKNELENLIVEAPECDSAHYFLALGLYAEGDIEGAADSIEKALSINYDKSYIKDACDIFFDLALDYTEKRDYINSAKYLDKCLLCNPNDLEVIHNMRKIHEIQGNNEEALKYSLKAAEVEKGNPETLSSIGILYSKIEKFDLAAEYFKKALQVSPEDAQTHYNLGLALLKHDKEEEAIVHFKEAIRIKPDFPEVFLNHGLALFNMKKFRDAIENYSKAKELRPNYVEAYINIAISYFKLYEFDSSTKYYEKALELDPNNTCALVNYGYLWQSKNELKKAMEYYDRLISIDPDNADGNFSLATAYLSLGDFKRGWEKYEWRFKRKAKDSPKLPNLQKPRWQGEQLHGKRILVYPEQGYGDSVQFSRFFNVLKSMGAEVVYKARPEMADLFRGSYRTVEIVCCSESDENIEFDYYTPLLSVPGILKVNADSIPFAEGYLKADPKLVKIYSEKYFSNNLLKVGVFWQGITEVLTNRHIPLEKFSKLFRLDGIKVYSFQKGDGIEELEMLPQGTEVVDLGKTFDSFSDTAAALENLDILVTVDTSVAHLAGAVSKKTLLMLPFCSEWRWMTDIDYTPWYKSVKILRQTQIGNWDDVVQSVNAEISAALYSLNLTNTPDTE